MRAHIQLDSGTACVVFADVCDQLNHVIDRESLAGGDVIELVNVAFAVKADLPGPGLSTTPGDPGRTVIVLARRGRPGSDARRAGLRPGERRP